jgi:hypothetical protein
MFLALLTSFFACEREFVYRGGEEGLVLSTDTVMFDTIFTAIGSTTHNFLIYNPYDEDMLIEGIELSGGDESSFRLNINGSAENSLTDIRLRGNDSLFVFVEVTIDPVHSNSPIVGADSVIITTRDRRQSVRLIAYGQDVILLKKEWLKTQTLTKDKPYLISEYIVVDTAQTLTVEQGARLYFQKDASMLVLGSLIVKGTKDEPVLFASDRLEDWYVDKPGQWGYIHLLPGSSGTTIDYAVIRNGTMGILADSVGSMEEPLIINNTKIEHVSTFGLLAQSANVKVTNTLFGDCGTHSLAITVGGEYEFTHCTFANYFAWSFRSTPAVFINNYYMDEQGEVNIVPLRKASFENCIVYGRNIGELGFDLKYPDGDLIGLQPHYLFSSCLLKVPDDMDLTDKDHFADIIRNEDPYFVNVEKYDYRLDSLSAAMDAGNREFALKVPVDILGVNRLEDDGPDLGLYERTEEK